MKPLGVKQTGRPAIMSVRQLLLAYAEQIDFEIMRHARAPGFLLPALLFPALLYGMFLYANGTYANITDANDARGDPAGAMFWLANYTSFTAIAPGLYLFAVSAAADRAGSFARWQRMLPIPPGAPLIGQLILAALSAGLGTICLLFLTWVVGGVLPPASNAAWLIGTASLCSLPFSFLGMLVGSLVSGKHAIAVVHALLLPLVIFSGLLIPSQLLPPALQVTSAFSPGHDVLMLTLGAVRPDLAAGPWHMIYLLLFALLLGLLAHWRLRQTA